LDNGDVLLHIRMMLHLDGLNLMHHYVSQLLSASKSLSEKFADLLLTIFRGALDNRLQTDELFHLVISDPVSC